MVQIEFFLVGKGLPFFAQSFAEFFEGKRHHGEFNVTARQQRRQFAGHEISVGASEIEVAVILEEEAVHGFLILRDVLNFIQKNVIFPVGKESLRDMAVERFVVEQVFVFNALKIDADDLCRRNSVSLEIFLEDRKERGLAAAADARHDLDDLFVFLSDKPVQIFRTVDEAHA